MRSFISCIVIVLVTFSLFNQEASAARFGGGRSFGVQRSHSSLFSSQAPRAARAFNPRPNTGRWASALGGLLVGGLLASLFMGHGFGTGILSWLMIGALIFFVVSFLKKRTQPAFQSSVSNPFQSMGANNATQFYSSSSNESASDTSFPAGFAAESFLRAAKVTFIRLQAAYDQKNKQDLMDFTAPDVFAEIKMQLDELGDTPNKTEIIGLEAELLNVSKQVNDTIASVRFTGFVKENNEPMSPLDEIWHFRQFANQYNWIVVGIQQEVIDLQ